MSPDYSYQDPKKPRITSVDLPGLLLDTLSMIESYYNI